MAVLERWTDRSGVRIRWLDNQPADAAALPVLFAPGFSDHADEYGDMLEFFLPRRLLVVEVRGRGRSEAPPTGYAAADHAADLAAVVDEAGLDRFHVMSFSRGTTWALDLVLSRLQQVASLSIGDYWAIEHGLPAEFEALMMRGRFRGRPMHDRIATHVARELGDASRDRALWDELGRLPFPVLLAHGTEAGSLITSEHIARYRAALPDIEVMAIPGSAHDLFRPDRRAYPRAVSEFLARRTPGL